LTEDIDEQYEPFFIVIGFVTPACKMADSMFINWRHAIQLIFDCVSPEGCLGVDSLQEEALIEIPSANHPE
jgi:hypothetical protein